MFVQLRRALAVATIGGGLLASGVAFAGHAAASQPGTASLAVTGNAVTSAGSTLNVAVTLQASAVGSLTTDIGYRLGDHSYSEPPSFVQVESIVSSSPAFTCRKGTNEETGNGDLGTICEPSGDSDSPLVTFDEVLSVAADAPEHAGIALSAFFTPNGDGHVASSTFTSYVDGPPPPVSGTVAPRNLTVRAGSSADIAEPVTAAQPSLFSLTFTYRSGNAMKNGYPAGVTVRAPAGCTVQAPADDGYTCKVASGSQTLHFTVTAAENASTAAPADMTAVLAPADNADDVFAHAKATLKVLPAAATTGGGTSTGTPAASVAPAATPSAGAPGRRLAETGASGTVGYLVAACALLLVGGGAIVILRRRAGGTAH